MAHSNQLREFVMSDKGINLVPAYVSGSAVLTGSARVAQEAKEKAEALLQQQDIQRKREEMNRKRLTLQAQIAALQAELATEEKAMDTIFRENEGRLQQEDAERKDMAKSRGA
jgi:circadian clock protein KaiC